MKYISSLIAAIVLLCASRAYAATYYLETTGADTNPGTALSPWLTLQKGFTAAQPGDTLMLGVGNFGSATTARSGTSVAPIIVQGVAGSEALAITHNHSWYVYNDIKVIGRINLGLTSSNSIIQDCVFDPITTTYTNNIASVVGGAADKGIRPSNHIIRRNQFLNAKGKGVGVSIAGNNHLVEDNYFSSQTGADAMWVFANNSVIKGNTFENWSNPSDPLLHTDLFQAFGNNGDVASNIRIENNLALDCTNCQLGNITDDKFDSAISNWLWINNIFLRVTGPLNLYSPGHHFYNNTWAYGPTTHSSMVMVRTSTDRGNSHYTRFFNNIFYKGGQTPTNSGHGFYALIAATGVPLIDFEADYNLAIGVGAGTIKAGAFTASGRNVNGLNGIDPLFVEPITPMSGADVILLPESPAILAGLDLSVEFTTDYYGNTRPGWDMGAISSGSAPPADVTAPTVTSAVVGTSGVQLTVNYSENVADVASAHYTLTGVSLSLLGGTGSVRTFTITPPVISGDTVTLGYTSGAGRTADAAGNLLATFSGAAVTSYSLATTPVPPRAGRKGRGPSKAGAFGR